MPSPFPGMDPYLEAHWRDVHAALIIYSRDALQGVLPGALRARVEERVLLETPQGIGDHPLFPDVRVIILSMHATSDYVLRAMRMGASGYLLKRTPQAEILEAIADVHRGNSPMSGHIARRVVQYFNQRGSAEKEIEKLSKREHEVLDHLAQGIPYKEIADVLSLSIDTVRMHIKGIYSKLHVHTRGEAVAKYLRK